MQLHLGDIVRNNMCLRLKQYHDIIGYGKLAMILSQNFVITFMTGVIEIMQFGDCSIIKKTIHITF